MTLKHNIYQALPDLIKPIAKHTYERVNTGNLQSGEVQPLPAVDTISSRDEYQRYLEEFDDGPAEPLLTKALKRYQEVTDKDSMDGVGLNIAKHYYAVTRSIQPEKVIETGVCNGVSTLAVLFALSKNKSGQLYSIDYPFRADESLEEFRRETFEEYGGAAIPADKNPGWIIPEELRVRWDLRVGKSQRELPELISDLGGVELFIHDSEHSHPCMMFEYELAYEWLDQGGIILSDDIMWNDAFNIFTNVRQPDYGRLSQNVGYIHKKDRN